jgi:hypothetical protein
MYKAVNMRRWGGLSQGSPTPILTSSIQFTPEPQHGQTVSADNRNDPGIFSASLFFMLRRVGPQHATDFGLRAQVEVTDVRNAPRAKLNLRDPSLLNLSPVVAEAT